ncbi:AT-rich binding protein isoform X2 [Drosophila eugracilis]|uniref:AT-rich binding protein isoform X2 n=1 Tax=Drosophila eugracilis TaxID=29029 RepID=UPI0007E7EE41|nr:AT-rich binding protein isoform X2 [Drosophila eugracilis]
MGFPRILSKNNKIYTKLGEFCLSGDSFWIVCHTCQEELQTQDQFWKHIQDEHNFLHGVTKEHSRTSSYCLTDVEAAATVATPGGSSQQGATAVNVPLALYHCSTKYSDEEQREVELHEQQVQVQQVQQQVQQQQHAQQQQTHQQHQAEQQVHEQLHQQRDVSKELVELHANAVAAAAAVVSTGEERTRSNSGVDIKIEPASLSLTPEMQAAAAAAGTIYHLPQLVPASVPPPPPTSGFVSVSANTSTSNTVSNTPPNVVQQQQQQLNMSVVPSTAMAAAILVASQEQLPKDSNSTTASAGSAVSSDDGERWYVCDYETCGLKFKYKSRMELHRVVHSKERRFNCELCSASFKQSCNLSTHRKKKHALRGIKSEILPQRF